MKPLRVLILAKVDCAGSGQRFADALRSQRVDATMVSERRSAYGFQVDVVSDDQRYLQRLVNAADVVHLKGDHLPKDYPELALRHKPVVITAGGSGFRRNNGWPTCYAQQWHPLIEYKLASDALGVLTPDLMYQGLNATWTPHAAATYARWRMPKHTIRIGHSPSDRRSKGTDTVVLPTMDELRRRCYDVELVMMEGLSNLECLQLKATCHLFFDQAAIPSYGLSAVEALSMGIPVVQYMTEEVRMRHPALLDFAPLNGEGALITFSTPTPEAAADAIDAALSRGTWTGGWHRLHRATLEYCERVHSPRAVANVLRGLYSLAQSNHRRYRIERG